MANDISIYSSFEQLYAKSENGRPSETLIEHSQKAARAALIFAHYQRPLIERIAADCGITPDELESRLFLAAYLHDIGKASSAFQERLRGRRAPGPPHPLLAWPYLEAMVPVIPGLDIPFETVAVISHHTPYYNGLYDDYLTVRPQSYLLSALTIDFVETALSFHDKLLNRPFPYAVRAFNLDEPASEFLRRVRNKLQMLGTGRRAGLIRDLMALFSAAVHHGDWLASGDFLGWQFTPPDLGRATQNFLQHRKAAEQDTFQEKVADSIQVQASANSGHLILVAPTGSGKTEAALLWAANRADRKLIYLLPTRVTSNAMYRRLKEISDPYVGLAHGTAALILGEEAGWERKNFLSEWLYGSTFMKPVTVATVDQVLLSKLHWSHWEMVETALAGANVIFDEIHAYDLYTLSLIKLCIEELLEKDCRIALLSATLPSYIRDTFTNLDASDIDLPKAVEQQRHSIEVMTDNMAGLFSRILDEYSRGKKILVVLNTVDEAVEAYKQLCTQAGKDNSLLFHSRFIEEHRREREERLQNVQSESWRGGFIAVTTQVVEVSLDVDFDILFTQAAPADALAQRMGRVNRRGKKGIVPVVVCQPDFLKSGKVYGEDVIADAWKIIPNGPISHSGIKHWVERQYPSNEWRTRFETRLQEVKQNLRELRNRLWHVQTVHKLGDGELFELVQTRDTALLTMDVIPRRFEDDARACQRAAERIKYIVRVPYWMVRKKLRREDIGLVADINYDDDLGVLRPIAPALEPFEDAS